MPYVGKESTESTMKTLRMAGPVSPSSSCRLLVVSVLGLSLLAPGAGCKDDDDEEVPEHIQQQRRREKRQEELEKKRRAEAKKTRQQRKKTDETRLWPKAVRLAVLKVYRARRMEVPRAVQALAHLGPPAISALRHLATSQVLDSKKRGLVSLMLVEMQMFRPHKLVELSRRADLPFVQQGAIEALGRLGNPIAEKRLKELAKELERLSSPSLTSSPHSGERIPPSALKRLLRRAGDASRKWWYSEKQLTTLDQIFYADSAAKLQLTMAGITNHSLKKGLLAIVHSPATRPPIQIAVAHKLIQLVGTRTTALRAYCAKEQHQMLRMLAAQRLLEVGKARDKAFIRRLSEAMDDPMAPAFERLLKAPPAGAAGAPR
jgi:hypothetical protein